MPRRTNTFQQVVTVIHEHMAGDATVEESAMFVDHDGNTREVDVAIKTVVASHEVLVCVEATATNRKADLPWVERMIAKHEALPDSSALVLVSQAGFTTPARRRAERSGVAVLEPADLEADDRGYAVLSQLTSLWPKQVSITAAAVQLRVRTPSGQLATVDDASLGAVLFLDRDTPLGTIGEFFVAWAQQGGTNTLIRYMADLGEDSDKSFLVRFDAMEVHDDDGTERPLYIEHGRAHELAAIEKGQIAGHTAIRIGEIPLQHQRLGKITFSYGEGYVGSQRVLGVMTERGITLRWRSE